MALARARYRSLGHHHPGFSNLMLIDYPEVSLGSRVLEVSFVKAMVKSSLCSLNMWGFKTLMKSEVRFAGNGE